LADDPVISSAFSNVCWQLYLTQRCYNDAKKIFSIRSLKDETKEKIEIGSISNKTSKDSQNILRTVLPYVYAWRCSKISKHEVLKKRLENLKITVVNGLTATLTLDDKYQETISKDFSIKGSNIYLNEPNLNVSLLALALADYIGVKSEADFYENLLRCNGDGKKLRNKLNSKDMNQETIDRYLREFNNQERDSIKRDSKSIQKPTIKREVTNQSHIVQEEKTSKSDRKSENRSKQQSTFQAKDIEKENIRFKSSVKQTTSSGVSKSINEKQGSVKSRTNVSYDDRMAIEESGRSAAEKKLIEQGYQVLQMPVLNPGFDIKAKKDGVELRIEVKAHRSKASTIELTKTEYKEYIRCQELDNTIWELWNIENLSRTIEDNITISRYQLLSEDAFKTSMLTINLNKCIPLDSSEI
jgi:hypothetical protein